MDYKGSSPIFVFEDTIKLKLGEDGHIVTNQYSHVIFTVCLLNEKDEVLKSSNQYCILLYIEKEKYEYLSLAVSQIINELDEIKDGFKDCDDVICTVELFFSDDWKFMALNITGNKKVPNELHVMLQITDILFRCFFYQLMEDINQFKKSISILIEQEMHQIGLTHFQFYESKTKSKYNWTMLNGTEKLNVLENFEVFKFVSGERGKKMEFLWYKFLCLYLFLRQDHITNEEIDSFEQAAKSWILKFCEPTAEKSNRSANPAERPSEGDFLAPYISTTVH
ncbi:hypothetical protein C1646_774684 [Rhizophagus diaphanus]|nr:hypothetical protein C1646_774684 [Rhizophagus diaphanus] [Rhizophagus sp. MUCL 43196]